MSQKTAYLIEIRNQLLELIEASKEFKEAVMDDHRLPFWIAENCATGFKKDTTHVFSRETVAETVTCITYNIGQNKQSTVRLPGVVGISHNTLQKGLVLNTKKNNFKKVMMEYRDLFGDSIQAISDSSEEVRDILFSKMKLHHIHFVQCYRNLKLLTFSPKRIAFCWAGQHSGSLSMSVDQALNYLSKKFIHSKAIEQDKELLEQLPKNSTVIIKRDLVPHLRANLTWYEQQIRTAHDKGIHLPKQLNAPLPIFIQLAAGEPLPTFKKILTLEETVARRHRQKRSDANVVKLSPNPHSKIYLPVEV